MKLNKKGFTLIELLAVIVILGVIMAIAIPAMTGYIDNSKKDSMLSSASTILSAAIGKVTTQNKLPAADQKVYVKVNDVELTSGGTSPYTNAAFSNTATANDIDTSDEDDIKANSFVLITNASGTYKYEIYLTDGTNCLAGTETDINGKVEAKRTLVSATNACTIPAIAGATRVK